MTGAADPPRARARFPGEFLLALRRDPLALFAGVTRDYGDAVHLRFPFQSVYLFNHPDAVREILITRAAHFTRGLAIDRAKPLLGNGLLTIDGEFHLRQRRLMQPAFHRLELARYTAAIAATADRHQRRWPDGGRIDVAREMLALTLAAVVTTLFDGHIEESADEVGEALGELFDLSHRLLLPLGSIWRRLPVPTSRRFRGARATLDAALQQIIEAGRRPGAANDNLLSKLTAAAASEGGMSDQQLRDEAMTLLLAGHETTASALTWTWFLLARHPDVARRLRDEVDAALGDRLPTAADLPVLPYAERVFSEAMRLYPPVWSIGRRARDEVVIGGYRVPRGALAVVCPWLIHRDPRFWSEPERFDPDRFAPAAKGERPRDAYFPFGEGRRRCIGENLALLLGVITIAVLVRRVRFEMPAGDAVRPLPYLFLLHPGYIARSTGSETPVRGLPMRVGRCAS